MQRQTWNPERYLQFADERTRPCADLAAAIRLRTHPKHVVDLGCGPGNSSLVLRQRWPHAEVTGIDSSAEMIAAAKSSFPTGSWTQLDIAEFEPAALIDVLFSNAAFQWLPSHATLLPRLMKFVAPDGVLAFQVPSAQFAAVRTLIHEISHDQRWSDRLATARDALTLHSPDEYYDWLANDATRMDLWETEYVHVLDNQEAIVRWMQSTGLRPFLELLSQDEQADFLDILMRRVQAEYKIAGDGKVLFPFRRTFVVAYK